MEFSCANPLFHEGGSLLSSKCFKMVVVLSGYGWKTQEILTYPEFATHRSVLMFLFLICPLQLSYLLVGTLDLPLALCRYQRIPGVAIHL